MSTPIFVSLGKKRYVGGTITETTGKDISGATFTIALGPSGYTPPAAGWVAPDVSTAGATSAQRIVKLLVTNTTPPGVYFAWANIVDSPEIEPILLQGPFTVA
jgi:hypothetical protein